MTRKSPRKPVDPREAQGFFLLAEQLYDIGNAAVQARKWNAAVLNLVHAVISYADAVTVMKLGQKAQTHDQAEILLREASRGVAGHGEALRRFARVVGKKEQAAYTGKALTQASAIEVGLHTERFRAWVLRILDLE